MRMQKKIYLILVVFCLSFFVGQKNASAVAPLVNGPIYATAVQSDGKMLIGGDFTEYNGTTINRIARLNVDGTLDTSFDPGAGANDDVLDIEILSDGKILIAGGFDEYDGALIFFVARLNADGSRDTTFALGEALNSWVLDAEVQTDGKIVIGGYFTWYDDGGAGASIPRIARLNADGSLDSSFVVGTGTSNDVYDIALQSDGKVIIGGPFTSYNGASRVSLARINTDGSVDTAFNPIIDGYVRSVEFLSTGQMYVGGAFDMVNGVAAHRIVRLNGDGSVDTNFDTTVGFGAAWGNEVYDLAVQSDGKIIAVGNFYTYDGQTIYSAARINSDGSLDATFNNSSSNEFDEVDNVSILPNGSMIMGGNLSVYDGYYTNGIAFINADGSYNPFIPTISADSLGLTEQIISREYQGGGVAQGWTGDDESWAYTLPFTFNFYGNDYTSLKVSSKGYVCFDENATCTGYTDILTRTNNEPMIVVAGAQTNNASDIYITENVDNVVIRWRVFNWGPMDNIEFELVLYNNGSFTMNYGDSVENWQEGFAIGTSSGTGTYTRSIYYNKIFLNQSNSVLWGSIPSGGGITNPTHTQSLSATIQETMTLTCGGDIDLDNATTLIPGIPESNTTTCTVTTNDAQGYNLSIANDRAPQYTLYHTTQSTDPNGQIPDKTPWDPNTPNAQAFTGDGLAFGILSSDATKNNTWWGTGTACDDANQLYAGIPQTDQNIIEHTTYTNTATDTEICYRINVPSTQIAGEYTGSVTYTATGRP